MEKKEYKNILFLIILCGIIVLTIFLSGHLFGSNMDWINQHTVFPEYFRNLFYETGSLTPNFAFNLGGGQNIFNFSYYGLLNPIILISYALPFIKMTNYIIISSIILLFLSVFLFYKWIRNHLDDKMSFITTLIFIMACPIIFHMHRQIMFVNYIPFLLLGLLSIDSNKKWLLSLSTFLMIMTSFYYSVGGILVLLIYSIYKLLKEKQFNFKKIISIIFPIAIGILLSSIILMPTLYVLLSGQSNRSVNYSLLDLLIPRINPDKLIYGSYSTGLTGILFISLISFIFSKKKYEKITGIILSILVLFPLFSYLLNGGLYIRAKSFIPFLPMFCLIIGLFINKIINKDIKEKRLIIYTGSLIILTLISNYFKLGFYLDIILTTLIIICYYKTNKISVLILPIIFVSIFSCLYANMDEDYVGINEYKEIFSNADQTNIESVLDADHGYYRISNLNNTLQTVNKIYDKNYYSTGIYSSIYNSNYYSFARKTMKLNNPYYNDFLIGANENILYNSILGVKYAISNNELGNGYIKIDDGIYQNELAYPLVYGTSNTIDDDIFKELNYPDTIDALSRYTVVTDGVDNYESSIEKVDFKTDIKEANKYILNNNEKVTKIITLDKTYNNKILLIEIGPLQSNSCEIGDISITINNVKNNLTCKSWAYPNNNEIFHYLISEKEISSLNLEFSKGNFEFDNINIYALDYDLIKEKNNTLVPANIDKLYNKGISGNITMNNDGYLVLSIPKDDGFKMFIDGNIKDIEVVNESFMGVKLSDGYHEFRLEYHSPYYKTGIIFSLIGLLLFDIMVIFGYRKSKTML